MDVLLDVVGLLVFRGICGSPDIRPWVNFEHP